MSSIIELYNQIFARSDENLDLEVSACSIKQTIVTHDTLIAETDRSSGPGWIEWTDAVRYREGDTWIAPAGNAPNMPDASKARILAGEIACKEAASSLRFRHLSGNAWMMEAIREEGKPCLKFEKCMLSAVQIGPNKAQRLKYVTYWDPQKGESIASRFTGFGGRKEVMS